MAPIRKCRVPGRGGPLLASVIRITGFRRQPATQRRVSPGGEPQFLTALTGEVGMTAVSRRSFLLTGGTAAAAGTVLAGAGATLLAPAASAAPRPASPGGIYVAAGQTYTVAATTRVSAVTIEP